MTLWQRIEALLAAAKERTLDAVMDAMAAQRRARDAAAFSIALIALSAKMAKADGVVTDDEVAAFCTFFSYPPEEEEKVFMIFRLATEDVAGFDSYARKVGKLFDGDRAILEDVLDCLFFMAMADNVLHPKEMDLLRVAADHFSVDAVAWRRIKAGHMGADKGDPYLILGVDPDTSDQALRAAYLALVKDNHPDALTARGVPADLIGLSEHRMATINAAYDQVVKERSA